MNFAAPMQYGIGANTVSALSTTTTAPDPFDSSALNPLNMSRTPERYSRDNAPSGKLLERVRVAASDLAELACVQAGWRFVSEKNNTTVYELNGAVLPSTVSVASTFGGAGGKASDYYLVKAVTTVQVDVDSVLTLLNTHTTEQYALRMNQVFGKHYQNGVVIDHMSCTTPPAQFQSEDGSIKSFTEDDAYAVNWLALRATGALDGSFDFTLASYQDVFQRSPRGGLVRLGRRAARDPPRRGDGTDRLLGVHALTSFNFKDIPELPKTKNMTRIHLRNTGFVVEETNERGVFRLTFFMALTPTATTLKYSKKFEKWLQTVAQCVSNLALQAKPEAVVQKKQVWSKSNHCMLCLKGFHAFRRCHHCRFCGDAVCNKCSGFVDVSKFDSVQTLHGQFRPAAMPAMSDQFSETRGCTRCIQSLMEDVHQNSQSVSGPPSTTVAPPGRLSSASGSGGSHSSGRNSKLSASFMSNPPLLTHEDDELSIDGSDSRSSATPIVRHHCSTDTVMALDELDAYDQPVAPPSKLLSISMFAKQPTTDPKSSLSMSTVSTSYSYEDQSLRVSGASHGSYRGSGAPTRYVPQSAFHSSLPPSSYQRPTSNDYSLETDVLALSGLSIHNAMPPAQLDDDEVDIDGPPHQFARSTVSSSRSSNSMNARPPRPTATGPQFKYSMMSNSTHSIHSEPEMEPAPVGDMYSGGGFYGKPSDYARGNRGPQRPMNTSVGPRFNPAPRPPLYHHAQPRSSSSASSTSSLHSHDAVSDMITLPAPSAQHNDMILLAPLSTPPPPPPPPAPSSPQFVVFSDSRRQSIFMRPDNGSDMIPLKF